MEDFGQPTSSLPILLTTLTCRDIQMTFVTFFTPANGLSKELLLACTVMRHSRHAILTRMADTTTDLVEFPGIPLAVAGLCNCGLTRSREAKRSKEPPSSCCPRITSEQETLALPQPGAYISFETSHSSPTKKISIKYFYWFNNLELLGLSKC